LPSQRQFLNKADRKNLSIHVRPKPLRLHCRDKQY
jgi:hypothetical protein